MMSFFSGTADKLSSDFKSKTTLGRGSSAAGRDLLRKDQKGTRTLKTCQDILVLVKRHGTQHYCTCKTSWNKALLYL